MSSAPAAPAPAPAAAAPALPGQVNSRRDVERMLDRALFTACAAYCYARSAAQAVGYGSRRDDSARCLMLFKQRLPDPPFEILGEEALAIGARRAELLALVRSLKLHEV